MNFKIDVDFIFPCYGYDNIEKEFRKYLSLFFKSLQIQQNICQSKKEILLKKGESLLELNWLNLYNRIWKSFTE